MNMYVLIPDSPFCDNWLDGYYPFQRPSLILKFPPVGFLGTFSMSFHIIFGTYSEKNEIVANLFNVEPNGSGLERQM